MKTPRLLLQLFAVFGLWLASSASLWAHHLPPGMEDPDEFEQSAFTSAVQHPFTGVDHALAALAIGSIALAWGRRQGAQVAGLFLASLAGGIGLGRLGLPLPGMEQGLAASILVAGCALHSSARLKSSTILCVSALVGAWHGMAHGSEMAVNSNVWAFTGGMLTGCALLLAAGAGAVLAIRSMAPLGTLVLNRRIGLGFCALGTWQLVATLA